jgi:hypothetical protein
MNVAGVPRDGHAADMRKWRPHHGILWHQDAAHHASHPRTAAPGPVPAHSPSSSARGPRAGKQFGLRNSTPVRASAETPN